jgi:AGCS family alanine or glycine:cation symporter
MIVALRTGLQRAMFSNEAGQGSSPIAHAAAKTDEPAREGFVGGLEPFVDTILVCSLTAMVILVTNTWNREPLGEMNGTVELVTTDTGLKLIAPTAIADLPPQPGGEAWIPGLRVYFIAETPNAANADIASKQRVEIEGTIVEVSGERVIRWNDPPVNAQWRKDENGKEIKGIYRRMEGSALTSLAYDRQFPGLGKWMVTLSVWLFAFSTLISWSYYGEQATIYLLGSWAILPYKIVYVLSAAITPIFIRETTELLAVIDFGTGAMLWGNLPIVLGLGYLSVNCLNDYRRRLRAGELDQHAAPPITDVVEGKDIERPGGR